MIDIKYYRKMKNIDRMAMGFKNRPYNLLEHCYGVGMLFRHFASLENVPYDINVWDIVLHHDIVEVETTDLPYTIKNFSQVTKQAWEEIEDELVSRHFQLEPYSDAEIKSSLTPLQFALFKACDMLDLWIFCKEEQAIGNKTRFVQEIVDNCIKVLNSLEFKFTKIIKFVETYEV